jgi:hypothetical protein
VIISHQPDGPEEIGRSHRSAEGDLADLPMQAQFRPQVEPLQSRFRENRRCRGNPASEEEEFAAAARASEEFHGADAHELIEVHTQIFEHDFLGDLGELMSLEIISIEGGLVTVKKFRGARLARSPKGFSDQLYIEGGDQSVDLAEFGIHRPHELEVLGYLKFVTYYTTKYHLGDDGGEANYRHKLNDGSAIKLGTKRGNRPTVVYDVNNQLLQLAGGEYEILAEGIDN